MFVNLTGRGPLNDQIYQAIRREILAGHAPAASRLPATRALARELGVSRNTVLLAYDQLLAEGYAEGRRGSGTYVAAMLPDTTIPARSGRAPARTVSTSKLRLSAYGRRLVGIPVLGPPAVSAKGRLPYDFRYGVPAVEEFPHRPWRRALARRARSASVGSMTYGPPEGYAPLRQALADYLRRARGLLCDPEQVLVVNGSQQALDLVSRVVLDPGDRVVIEEPHYQGARYAFLATGARLVPAPVDAEGFDVRSLPAIAATARLVYVTPSHQFPTGVVMPLGRRLALLSWARRTGAYVVEDDYDSEYRYEGRPIETMQGLDRAGRVIYVGTLSKVLFPALRIGYLVLPPPLVGPFRTAKSLVDRHTSTLEQEVLAELIADGSFERHLRRSRTRYGERRAALLQALADTMRDLAEVVGANAGLHLLVWLRGIAPPHGDSLIRRAADVGVGLYPIAPYYLTPPRRVGLLLGYASLTEAAIRAGIRRLAGVVMRPALPNRPAKNGWQPR